MTWLPVVARIAVGAVLITAGVAKLRSKRWMLLALEMGTPKPVVLTLPAFETLLGLSLVAQLATAVIPWVSVALFMAFTAIVTLQYAAGSEAPCNCFGGNEEAAISKATIVRNLGLVALALIGTL